MSLTRRRFSIAAGAFAASCTSSSTTPSSTSPVEQPMPSLAHRPLSALPKTTLSWLNLRDHFVATVGENAGRGRPLGDLLVLADATFSAGSRFPLHPHQEMEILSIVVDGTLSHHGDQAHGAVVPMRHAQLISARDGMVHAEGNDTNSAVRMLQIWFRPTSHGGAPAYFDVAFEQRGRHTIVSGDGSGGMPLRSDARVEWVDLDDDASKKPERFVVGKGRAGYVMALTTTLTIGDLRVAPGEGVVVGEGAVDVSSAGNGAALFIDVAR